LEWDALSLEELLAVSTYYITTEADNGVPKGAVMSKDPYMQYLESLPSHEAPKQVDIAKESASLRTIFPLVNTQFKIEAVMDSGSQIVLMSLADAQKLMLSWDPDIQIYMQSANSQLEKTVGLVKNVPFQFGDV
ncbi:hypothetical protein B0H10DRAFT_1694144, partial [Mycena sp. CBHHK59/15]